MAKYTEQVLREAVAASQTMADVMRHLGLRLAGGTHAHLRRRVMAFGIDTSHFLGRGHGRNKPTGRRLTAEQVLVRRSSDRRRAHPDLLRRSMQECGIPHLCAECDLGTVWNGRPIILHVDHINGDFADCRLENLRFLCPNCHSQSPTHSDRNRGRFPPATDRP